MVKRKLTHKRIVNKFAGPGAGSQFMQKIGNNLEGTSSSDTLFNNIINSGIFLNFNKLMSMFNQGTSKEPNFLSMNQGVHGGGLMGAIGSSVDATGLLLSGIDNLLTKERKPLEEVIGLRANGGPINSYGLGGLAGGMGMSDYMNMGTTAMALTGNAIQQAKTKDINGVLELLNSYGNAQFNASNNDLVMEAWNTMQYFNPVSSKDIRNKSFLGDFADSLSASALGFSAGSKAGPAGAILGGIVGGGSSLLGSLIGRNKAKKKAKKVNNASQFALTKRQLAAENLTDNVDTLNDFNLLAETIVANGGPINILSNNPMSTLNNMFKIGGGLSRDKDYNSKKKPYPSVNKGDFAGGGRSYPIPTKADAIDALRLAGLHGRSDVKSKVYAKYPSLKKHDLGGPLFTNGTDWSNDLTIIGNGGTHEENPYDGVLMGYDNQGVPNLVEEGEVVWNDYVFSNRLKPSKEVKNKYKLKGNTFAEAVKYLQKESEERPNDPISKRSLDTMLAKLANEQELIRQAKEGLEGVNYAAKGGNLHKCGGKMGNLFAGTGDRPNLLSDPYIPPQGLEYFTGYGNKDSEDAKKYFHILNDDGSVNWEQTYNPNSEYSKLRNFYIENWDNPLFKKYKDAYVKHVSEENKDIDLSKITLDDFKRITSDKKLGYAHDLNNNGAYELYKRMNSPLPERNIPNFASLAKELPITIDKNSISSKKSSISSTNPFKHRIPNSWLRYMPVVGSAIGLGMSFKKPDYSNADRLGKAGKTIRDIEFNPIGNYLAYRPFDRNYYLNKLEANAAGTRSAIRDNISPSSNAALLAADYNMINNMGNLARQAEEYNLAQRQKVEEFNRGTNMFNSEGFLKADTANLEADKIRLNALMAEANMREEIAQGRRNSIYGNLTNLFNNLGAVGTDNVNRKFMNMLIDSGAVKAPNMAAKGGKLKRRKKGLTY